jgi:hypothetical protein
LHAFGPARLDLPNGTNRNVGWRTTPCQHTVNAMTADLRNIEAPLTREQWAARWMRAPTK